MKWQTRNLGTFCSLVNGKAFRADEWSESGLPIIRIQNLNDSTKPFNHWRGGLRNQVHVQQGELLIAWSGTPGTSFGAHIWNGLEGVLNQHIFRVDLKNGTVTKEWLKFCVNTQLLRLIDKAHGGVGLKHVTKDAVESLQIPLPPLAEQKRIAAILDAADALRAKRRESLALLDTLLQSTFLDMFGDPVENPMGWEVASVGDVAERLTVGIVVKPASYYRETGVPALRSLNIRANRIDTESLVYVSPDDNNSKLKKTRVWENDVLLVRSGQPGTAAVVPAELAGVNAIDILILTPDQKVAHPVYLCRYFNSAGGRRMALGAQRGQIQKHLNVSALESAPIPLPPLKLQDRFAAAAESIEQQKGQQRAHLAELDTLFASLQSRAFRGEL